MMGESAGFTFRNEGGLGMPGGSSGMASAMAVCTSTAAPSIFRPRSNWSVTCEVPSELARGHRIDARNRGELSLQGRGHGRRHGRRVGARQAGDNAQRREIHRRQVAHRQRLVGDDPEQGDSHHQQGGGHRTADKQ